MKNKNDDHNFEKLQGKCISLMREFICRKGLTSEYTVNEYGLVQPIGLSRTRRPRVTYREY